MEEKKSNSLTDVLERMMRFYAPKFGLANFLTIEEMKHETIKRKNLGTLVLTNVIPMYRSNVGNSNEEYRSGCGASLSKEKSQVKALGEFIERYSATNGHGDHPLSLHYNTYPEQCKLGDCLDPMELIDFEDSAYDVEGVFFTRYTHDRMVSWVQGTELTSGKPAWVPAQKAFLGIPFENGEGAYVQGLSTGVACGSSVDGATISGILEVVERDSFMLTWLLKLPGKKIIMDGAEDSELMKLYRHICSHLVGDDSLHIYDISRIDGVYTVLTFFRNDNPESYGLVTAAASDTDPEHALLKSLEELCLSQAFAYAKLFSSPTYPDEIKSWTMEDVRTLHLHFFYYGTGSRSYEFDFISESQESVRLSEMPNYTAGMNEHERLFYLSALFRSQGLRVYAVDLTRPEVAECGLAVVSAIIPGFNDLDVCHRFRLLNNQRLREFQKRFNRPIRKAPHPFP